MKNAEAHTPGPWRFDPLDNSIVQHETSKWIASIMPGGSPPNREEYRANAALIAFAPTMHAFIERWRKIIDGGAKSAEGWAKDFEEEAREALGGAK